MFLHFSYLIMLAADAGQLLFFVKCFFPNFLFFAQQLVLLFFFTATLVSIEKAG